MSIFAIVLQEPVVESGTWWLSAFFSQPIDQILMDVILYFGWIPFVFTLLWGFTEMWLSYREGLYQARIKHIMLAIDVPAMSEQTPKAVENLFSNLFGVKSGILWKEKWITGKKQSFFSFEIVSTEGYIQFYVRCEPRYRDIIEAGIYAHYPQAEIMEADDYTEAVADQYPSDEYDMWGSELKLKKDNILPIRTYVDFEDKLSQEIKDPLGQILEQLAKMKPGEHFWMQFIIRVTDQDEYVKKGIDYIKEVAGFEVAKPKSPMIVSAMQEMWSLPKGMLQEVLGMGAGGSPEQATLDAERIAKMWRSNPIEKERVDGILRKLGKVHFEAKTRLLYVAKKNVYAKGARAAIIKGMLHLYTHHNMNSFGLHGGATPQDDYFWQRWVYHTRQTRLIRAYKKRSMSIGAKPSILNTEELASLWHFPPITIKAPLVKKVESRRGEPPSELSLAVGEEQLPLGPPPAPLEETMGELVLSTHGIIELPSEPEEHVSSTAPHVTPPTREGLSENEDVPDNLPL